MKHLIIENFIQMKNLITAFILFIALSINAQSIENQLQKLSKEYHFRYKRMENDPKVFSEKYVLFFEQPVNHYDPDGAKFEQRVFLSHKSIDKPVVFVTEGYSAGRASRKGYSTELAQYLDANQIVVEHRYFDQSVPENLDWQYLTVFNAASDHHRIVQVLKHLYKKKWLNTGISKGGQTAVYHRYFYPEDVSATVGYVCPINFSKEDKRAYIFLDTVGSSQCRNKIYEYQKELLKNKQKYLPVFQKSAEKKHLTYRMGVEKGFELTVFEFSFAFWQWGDFSCEDIPMPPTAKPKEMIDFLDKVSSLEWISDQGIEAMQPFFYQALRELGMYGYKIDRFKQWTTYKHNVTFDFAAPEGVSVVYSPELMRRVDYFIRHQATNMILIYGASDPWSMAAGQPTYQTNTFRIMKAGGNHKTRIRNLPENQRKQVLDSLYKWME